MLKRYDLVLDPTGECDCHIKKNLEGEYVKYNDIIEVISYLVFKAMSNMAKNIDKKNNESAIYNILNIPMKNYNEKKNNF